MTGKTDLFFRSTDRLRMEGCVAAVLNEGMSLIVSSQHDAVLDHYGKILVERLRQSSPNTQVEIYFPAHPDVVLGRFNAMVAEHTFEQAMKASAGQPPSRIWLVHDAGALADNELQLLSRLVQSFPGARVRLLFLLGSRGQGRSVFDNFGRGMLRWDVEVPSTELAQTLLEQAKVDGQGPEVQALLAKISLPPAKSPPGFEKHLLMEAVDEQPREDLLPKPRRFNWLGLKPSAAVPALKKAGASGGKSQSRGKDQPRFKVKANKASAAKSSTAPPRWGTLLKSGALVLILLMASFAVALFLHPELLHPARQAHPPLVIKPIGQVIPATLTAPDQEKPHDQ